MPAKFRLKNYKAETYYHIYNKGIDNREVFLEDADYEMFLRQIRKYVEQHEVVNSPRVKPLKPSLLKKQQMLSLVGEVEVIAYCLLNNHFHILVYQKTADGIIKFMRRVMTGYVMYFNKKYQRHGPLWEMNYRAVDLVGEEEVLAMTKYIHLNPVTRTVRRFGPVETISASRPEDYIYSSYGQYIVLNNNNWVKNFYGRFDAKTYEEYTNQGKSEVEKILGQKVLE